MTRRWSLVSIQLMFGGLGLVTVAAPSAAAQVMTSSGSGIPTRDRVPLPPVPLPDSFAQQETTPTDRLISLALHDVTLEAALAAIRAQAGILIAYGDRVVPLGRRVSLVAERMPAIEALRLVLRGTDVGVKVLPKGQVMLTQRPAAQDSVTSVIVGRVIDTATRQPIAMMRISLNGTPRAAVSSAAGAYQLIVPHPGTYILSARGLGYSPQERTVVLKGHDTVVVSFALTALPTRLQQVVTTGAGDRARYEVGNSIAVINADSVVPTTPIRNLSDLLNTRATGVDVSSTNGTVGSGSRIRIRGISSLLASSDPIVIVDGVRVNAAYTGPSQLSVFAGGTIVQSANVANPQVPAMSRLDDIDPETIESVEVLKGPAASTLYGSDAANGVIVIKTKHGRPGPTRWTFSAERGISSMDATFAQSYHGWGFNTITGGSGGCTLITVAANQCQQDSVTHFSPLAQTTTSPFTTGLSGRYSMQLSGGTDRLQYFLGSTYDDASGVLKLPSADETLAVEERNGRTLPDWMVHPNVLNGVGVTSTMTSRIGTHGDVTVSVDGTHRYHQDAPMGSASVVGSAALSPGYRDTVTFGWGVQAPINSFVTRNSDVENRLTGSVLGNWRPLSTLTAHATVGTDYGDRRDESLTRESELPGLRGSRARFDNTTQVTSVDLGSALDVPVTTGIRLRSSVGGQYTRNDESGLYLNGTGLPAGAETIAGAASVFGSESNDATVTAGWYIEELASMNERLFLTVALRGDAGSAFGAGAKTVLYPKWSASWLISQEPFFPRARALESVRLRAAFGNAGVQPTTSARFRTYQTTTAFVDTGFTPVLSVGTIGNPALRPERSTEFEGGLDIGLWDERLTMEGTLYHKTTHDALVTRTLPPSLGIASRQENLGKLSNSGLEFSVTARPIETRAVTWSSTVGFSRNRNKLITLGPTTMDAAAPGKYAAGYPIDGVWARPILGFADLNNNGIIELSEIKVADSAEYLGQTSPKMELSLHNSLSLFSGWITVAAGLSYRGDMTQLNYMAELQCALGYCRGAVDPSAPVEDKVLAAVVARGDLTDYPYFERISSFRFSELSMTVSAPAALRRAVHASAATVSLMGRNLGLWTKYRGADPEVNTINSGNQVDDEGGIPQPRDWTLRVNLNY